MVKEMNVKLISTTPDAEKLITYIARVSSPKQNNPEISRLLKYCIDHKHWSVFEQAHMTVEIKTSRAISAQIIRHKTFNFSEFSQRYAKVQDFVITEPRRQDLNNRQNSINDLPFRDREWFVNAQQEIWDKAQELYKEALNRDIAKECARMLLPISASTTLYMTGSLRSWIHYLDLRTGKETQFEHRKIAESVKKIFIEQFPIISTAKEWLKE